MTLIGVAIFAGIFAVFDAIRRLNKNVIQQTKEIKELREELRNK
ncbi:hypothetical protein [Salibacterium salarium]|nr:hypothetical protein [Salibacterium salarium]